MDTWASYLEGGEGSRMDEAKKEWFSNARRRCVDDLRALLSIRMAQGYAEAILRAWRSGDEIILAALHSSCVTTYAKPFKNSQTAAGKIRYPIKELKKSNGFDQDLHDHIITIRDQIVAHSDYEMFPSTMYVQLFGDAKLPVELGVNVMAMSGINHHILAIRYNTHVAACADALKRILNDRRHELAAEAKRCPEDFKATHNLPELAEPLHMMTEDQLLLPPSGPAGSVQNPSFPKGLDGYKYMKLTHRIPLIASGTHIIDVGGILTEITLTVGKGQT